MRLISWVATLAHRAFALVVTLGILVPAMGADSLRLSVSSTGVEGRRTVSVSSGGIADIAALQFDVVWSGGDAARGAIRIGPAGAALNLSLTGNFIPDSGSLGFLWFDPNLAPKVLASEAVLFEFDLDAKAGFAGKLPIGVRNVVAASSLETLVVGETSMDADFGNLVPVTPTVLLDAGNAPVGGWMAPATVPLMATVDAKGNAVTKVQFLVENQMVGESAAAPYAFVWSASSAGTRSVVARVFYGSGQSADSAPVSVTVREVPVAKVILGVGNPPAGGWVAPATVPLSVTIDVQGKTVTKVQFLANGELLEEVAVSPYAFTWNGVGVGTKSVVARAFLGSGQTVDSSAFDLSVQSGGVKRSVTLEVKAEEGTPNRRVRVLGWGLSGIVGLEFELKWDGAKAKRKSIRIGTGGTALGLESGEWFSEATDGIKLLWNDALIQSRTVPDGAVLFEVLLEPLAGGGKLPITIGQLYAIDSNLEALNATTQGVIVDFGGTPPPSAPSIGLTVAAAPAGGWVAPATLSLSATVAGHGNTVTKVQFLADGQVLGEDAAEPYTWSWTGVTTGTRTLVARAVYGANETVDSASVSTVVGNPAPMVVLDVGTAPVGGWLVPATIPLSATVTAQGNTITTVQFLADGQVVGEDATAPYKFTWVNVTSGTKLVVARVVYGSNQTVDSASVSTVVGNPAPMVVLGVGTAPAGGWLVPATIPLSATVTAQGNTITKVQFLADGQVVGEDATAPYNFTWANVTSGTKLVVARVVYGSNQTVDSTGIAVVVSPFQPRMAIDPVGFGQGVTLVFTAPKGFEVVVETATDLLSWNISNRVPGLGPDIPVRISINPDGATTARFWRVKTP